MVVALAAYSSWVTSRSVHRLPTITMWNVRPARQPGNCVPFSPCYSPRVGHALSAHA